MNGFARRGACPALSAPMLTGDGLLVRLNPLSGGLSTEALVGLCEAAARSGNGLMEVTQRGSIQIRGLTSPSACSLAVEVDALGVAVRTGVPVETGPLAGLDPDETADPRPLAETIRIAIETAALSRQLGPKVSVIVDGGGRVSMDGLLADVRLTAVERDARIVWHLAVGGTAATARTVGLFAEADACERTIGILEAIAELGLEGRGRDIMAPRAPTPDPSPQGGEETCGGYPGSSDQASEKNDEASESPSPLWGGARGGGARPSPPKSLLSPGIFPLTDSTLCLGVALPFGSIQAERLAGLAEAATDLGATEIRSAPGRMLLVPGLSAEPAASLQTKAAALGFFTAADDRRLRVAACPGAPACASGRIATRALAETIAARNDDMLDGSFTLHVSGCAKGCAHPGASALTLTGGENGVALVAGGTAGSAPFGYVPERRAAGALDAIASLVAKERASGETAAACLARLGRSRLAQAVSEQAGHREPT